MNKTEALNILELSGDPSEDDIKTAYRKLAKLHHPDANQGSKESEEKFKQIGAAYEYLTTPQSRMTHDRFDPFAQMGEFQDFVKQFMFTGSRETHQPNIVQKLNPAKMVYRGTDVDVGSINVDFTDAMFKEELVLNLKVRAHCNKCLQEEENWYPCSNCKQFGVLQQAVVTPFGHIAQQSGCPLCAGLGWKKKKHCMLCKDKLVYLKAKEVRFVIPDNYRAGDKIRLSGAGNENWNCPHSDVFVEPKISLPNITTLSEEEKLILKGLLKK